eukprot:11420486-Alexandrium_andersonii.AAC.1
MFSTDPEALIDPGPDPGERHAQKAKWTTGTAFGNPPADPPLAGGCGRRGAWFRIQGAGDWPARASDASGRCGGKVLEKASPGLRVLPPRPTQRRGTLEEDVQHGIRIPLAR